LPRGKFWLNDLSANNYPTMEAIRDYLQSEDPNYEDGVRLLGENTKNRNLVQQLGKKESVNNWSKLRYELAKIAGDLKLAPWPESVTAANTPPPAPALPGSVRESLHQIAQAAKEVRKHAPDTDAYRESVATLEQLQRNLVVVPKVSLEESEEAEASLTELATKLTPEALAEVEAITVAMSETYNLKTAASNSLGDATSRADRKRIVDTIQELEDKYNLLAEKKRLVTERGTATPAAVAQAEVVPTLGELLKQRGNMRSNLSKARKNAEKSKTAEKKSEYEQKAGKLELELEELELLIKKAQQQPQA
jgi:hypothetical protein